MTTDTITERLVAQADKELRKQLEDDPKFLHSQLQWYSDLQFPIGVVRPQETVTLIRVGEVVKALINHAYENRCESNRAEKIKAFMDKVEALSADMEEIKNQIQ